MRAGKRAAIAAACASVALVAPAAASAKVKTYGGDVSPEGKIAMDVKVSKKGVAKKIIAIRGKEIPSQCEKSGEVHITVDINRDNAKNPDGTPFGIKVKPNGRFHFSYTDPTYNQTKAIDGRFTGAKDKNVAGVFEYGAHYPADETYPEENCSTGPLDYTAKRGGPDVVLSRAAGI